MSITIKVAKDFSETPGTRFSKDGNHSGEEFRENYLKPKYIDASKSDNGKLIIDLDGGYGYPTSFLEEAFGGLARQYKNEKEKILNTIEIISEDDPALVNEIKEYIKKA